MTDVTLLVPLALLLLARTTGLALGSLTPSGVVQYRWVTIRLAFTVAGIVLTLVAAADAATAMTILRAVYEPFGHRCDRRRHIVR